MFVVALKPRLCVAVAFLGSSSRQALAKVQVEGHGYHGVDEPWQRFRGGT
jgi:hypothetical protein